MGDRWQWSPTALISPVRINLMPCARSSKAHLESAADSQDEERARAASPSHNRTSRCFFLAMTPTVSVTRAQTTSCSWWRWPLLRCAAPQLGAYTLMDEPDLRAPLGVSALPGVNVDLTRLFG